MALALEGQTLLSVEQHRWLLELGPGGAVQEGEPLCIGRRDPITCLGSEGDTDPPWGLGQAAGMKEEADGEGRAWLWENQDGLSPGNAACQQTC